MSNHQKIDINFTGDISFTGIFRQKVIENEEIFNDSVLDAFIKADFNVINLEGPSTNSINFYRNNGLVVSPLESIEYLTNRKIKHFNLANNHLFDNGVEGFKDTVSQIRKHKGGFFGAGLNIKEASEPIVLEKDAVSVAMVGVCHNEGMLADKNNPGIFCLDKNLGLLRRKLSELKNSNDWVVLNYHGGEEYTRIPMPRRRKLLRKLSSLDCDLIVAHHSHIFQGYEVFRGKHIFYSLGNFVFDIPNHKNIQFINLSAILRCSFTKDSFQFSIKPTRINLENGRVEDGSPIFLKTINDISRKIVINYYKNWLKESHRAFFKSKLTDGPQKTNQPKRHQSLGSLVKDANNIKLLFALLNSPNKRPLFISSMLYKALMKLNLINEKS